jgi:16S rRNA A1518/A1519 N6-dimethyltransferase RsmA/KsgA/DIM1 with predicted DNA glycosylase/AP lyase activity
MKIDINVPDGISGEWEVKTFEVKERELSQIISMVKYGRGVPSGTYKKLMRGEICVMSNTPDEIRDFMSFVIHAKGSVLINGLGLGVLLQALLNKPEVCDITVIEKSEDVIKLVSPTYLTDSRVTIINADAFEYKPPKNKRYDAVWHDIWDYISSGNLKEMETLHRKYGRRTNYQRSWCMYQCEKYNKRNY